MEEGSQQNGQEGKKVPNKRWKASESRFFLQFMAEQIQNGVRIDKAFKTPMVLQAIEALKVNCNASFSEHNITNHMRTLKRRWARIKRLKDLSGVGWDENKKMIVMGEGEYKVFIMSHPDDEPFLNKPIADHDLLEIVCGNDQATGRFATHNLTESISMNDGSGREDENIVHPDDTNFDFLGQEFDFTSDTMSPRFSSPGNNSQSNTSHSGNTRKKGKRKVADIEEKMIDTISTRLETYIETILRESLRGMNRQLSDACMRLIELGYTAEEAAEVYAHYGADEAKTCNFLEASELFRQSLARRVIGHRGGAP